MERWQCQPGMIVKATAGRDAGRYYLVTALDSKSADLYLADGKRRTLLSPKRKNPAHVQKTNRTLSLEGLTDRALRTALKDLNDQVSQPQSKPNRTAKEVIDDVEAGCN